MPRLLTVALLLLTACADSATQADGAADDAHVGDSATTDADAQPPEDAATQEDSAVPEDAATGGNCTASVTEASLCVAHVSAQAGTRVAIPVHVLLPAGCPHTTQSSGRITPSASVGSFVTRPLTPPECKAVALVGEGATFARLSMSASAPCPASFPSGVLMDVELDVAASVAPGQYTLALTQASLGDNIATQTGGCKGNGMISGTLTVLP